MMQLPTYFAAAQAAEQDSIFGALGIDWRLLILQIVAFAILVWLLGKFVYPHLINAIDKREQMINDSVKAAHEAEENAEKTQAEIEKLFAEARSESSAIVATAQQEAAALVKEAEDRSKKRADQIIADARQQLDQDVMKARKALRQETADLVALATEKIVREKVDSKKDQELIAAAIKESA